VTGGRGEGAPGHPLTRVVQLREALPLRQVLVEICQPVKPRFLGRMYRRGGEGYNIKVVLGGKMKNWLIKGRLGLEKEVLRVP
jgi:hypothetical protein